MLSRSASDGDAAGSHEVLTLEGQAARCSSTGELDSERPRRKWKRYRRVLGPDDEFEVMMAAMSYVEVKTVADVGDLPGDTQPAASLASSSRLQVSPPRCGALGKRGTRRASLELAHAIDCSASAAHLDRQVPGGASARGFFQRVRFEDAALPASTGEGDEHTMHQRIPGTPRFSPGKAATPESGDAEQPEPAAPDTATADHNPDAEALPPHVQHAPDARLCPAAGLSHAVPAAAPSPSHAVRAAASSPSHRALCSPTRGSPETPFPKL